MFGNEVKLLRIGELARLAGVTSRTIDYYTQMGIISEAARSPGKHRLYSQEALKTIKIIKELQKQHYSLQEIYAIFKENKDSDLLEKTANIGRYLDNLQKEVAGLYPAIRLCGSDEQFKSVSSDIINKSLLVMQSLIFMINNL